MSTTKDNYLHDLFINEARPALDRHSASTGDKPSQTKTIDITENGTVVVNPDSGYVMSGVTAKVNVPVPEGYIRPTGTKDITENGEHNVTEYEKVNVNVESSGGGSDETAAMLTALIDRTATEIVDNNVEAIGTYAFYNYKNLVNVNFPNLKIIGPYAFGSCTSLATTKLPDSILSIDTSAFYNCSKLALTKLPSGLTGINSSVFNKCTNLNIVELPSGVTGIAAKAFADCSKLALTKLPSRLTAIGESAFSNCKNITITEIPSGVTYINAAAFKACVGLTSITFKGTPMSITPTSFSDCTNLTVINVPWAEGAVAYAPWGATNATINYNYVEEG